MEMILIYFTTKKNLTYFALNTFFKVFLLLALVHIRNDYPRFKIVLRQIIKTLQIMVTV